MNNARKVMFEGGVHAVEESYNELINIFYAESDDNGNMTSGGLVDMMAVFMDVPDMFKTIVFGVFLDRLRESGVLYNIAQLQSPVSVGSIDNEVRSVSIPEMTPPPTASAVMSLPADPSVSLNGARWDDSLGGPGDVRFVELR